MNSQFNTDQEKFWAETYAHNYIEKNSSFDQELGVAAWTRILEKTVGVESLLECGCNIGRNLMFLNDLKPQVAKSIIEISKPAFDFVTKKYDLKHVFNGSILDSRFEPASYDLVFTMSVLIHISPD